MSWFGSEGACTCVATGLARVRGYESFRRPPGGAPRRVHSISSDKPRLPLRATARFQHFQSSTVNSSIFRLTHPRFRFPVFPTPNSGKGRGGRGKRGEGMSEPSTDPMWRGSPSGPSASSHPIPGPSSPPICNFLHVMHDTGEWREALIGTGVQSSKLLLSGARLCVTCLLAGRVPVLQPAKTRRPPKDIDQELVTRLGVLR